MQSAEVDEIQQFIAMFISKENSMIDLKIEHEIPVLVNFLVNYNLIETIALKLIENEAPKFNLFSILQISHLEAKVHTPFLVELLNPDGKHRQGRLFFDAFMIHLFGGLYNREIVTDIKVVKETSDYTNGRMDIIIYYREAGVNKEIVIENKIYHHDEKDQLTRYHRYLTQTRRLKTGEFHLIYLTPYKTKPTSESISPALYESLKYSQSLSEWGYYEDIDVLLKRTLPAIKAPVVTQTIHQYIDAIQFL